MSVMLLRLDQTAEALRAAKRAYSADDDCIANWACLAVALGRLAREQGLSMAPDAIEWLCRAWQVREQLSPGRVMDIERLLLDLGADHQQCFPDSVEPPERN